MDNTYVVYKHTAPNGKVYIGITCRVPEIRWGCSGNKYRNNKHFYSAIQKYGWSNIKHEILYDGLSKHLAEVYEKLFIFAYNSSDRRYGYNNTLGGEHGKMSAEVNAENSRRGKLLIGPKNPFYGRKHSAQSREKMRNARLNNPDRFEQSRRAGLKAREKVAKKVSQYSLDGEYITSFESCSDAAFLICGDKGGGHHISEVCRGERKMAYGYRWQFV